MWLIEYEFSPLHNPVQLEGIKVAETVFGKSEAQFADGVYAARRCGDVHSIRLGRSWYPDLSRKKRGFSGTA